MSLAHQVFRQIFDDPAADDGVVGDDQNRNDGVDPAAHAQRRLIAEGLVSADRALAGHAADRSLRNDHRVAEGHRQNDVYQQENSAAVFGGQIRKAPDVAEADGAARRRQDEADLASPLGTIVFHVIFSFNYVSLSVFRQICPHIF